MSGRVPAFPAPPADSGVFQPFWEAVAQDRLALPRCLDCGRWIWYPVAGCPACGSARIEWTRLAGTGSLFTFTVVHRPFVPDLTLTEPYVVGLVEFDEAPGVRLVADVDVDPALVRVGMRLRVRFETAAGRRRPVFEALEVRASSPG
jgi:uncharacterized OB-fold protein